MERGEYTIDDYTVMRFLGKGMNGIVVLARHSKTNELCAIKLAKEDSDPNIFARNMQSLKSEADILKNFSSPYIMKLHHAKTGVYSTPIGQNTSCFYERLQLGSKGNMIDYLIHTGKFSEKVARYYFKQLIEALSHCQSKGYCHRDIKPDNIMLDDQFNLLLCDFGFATLLCGEQSNGKLSEFLGTVNYMAPEIHLKRKYMGTHIDVFSAGVVLFIMITGMPPFSNSMIQDAKYEQFYLGDHNKFWTIFTRRMPNKEDAFSDEFKDLVNFMLDYTPTIRPSYAEILAHPWVSGNIPSPSEVQIEMKRRKLLMEAKIQEAKDKLNAQKKKIESSKKPRNIAFEGLQKRFRDPQFTPCNISPTHMQNNKHIDEELENIKFNNQPEEYIEVGTKIVDAYISLLSPQELFKMASMIASNHSRKVNLDPDTFNLNFETPTQDFMLTIDLHIYTMAGDTLIEFTKVDGNIFEYHNMVEVFKKELEEIESSFCIDA